MPRWSSERVDSPEAFPSPSTVYIHIRTYICMHTHTFSLMRMHGVHTCTDILDTGICTRVVLSHTRTDSSESGTDVQIQVHIHVWCKHTYVHMLMRVRIHVWCDYTHMYALAQTCRRMYICMCVSTHYMHVEYTCMYDVRTHTRMIWRICLDACT